MEILTSPYRLIALVVIVLFAWSKRFHRWSILGNARQSNSPLRLAVIATAASALFLISGIIGFSLNRHEQFVAGTAWKDGVIWREVVIGLVLAPVAIYLLRRSNRRIGHS